MLKKIALSLAIAGSLVAGAAKVLDIKDVNEAIAKFLEPLNSATTKAQVVFTYLDIADDLTQRFGGNLAYSKIGSQNRIDFNIPVLDYQYKSNNGLPHLAGQVELKVDLVKAYGQKYINETAEEAAELVKEFAEDMAEDFGDAVTIDAAIDSLERDNNGDVVRVLLHLAAKIDLDKLPEGTSREDVWGLGGRGDIEVRRDGAELKVDFDFNPEYRGFKKEQKGLKEYVEGLLNGDKDTYEQIAMMVGWVDKFAEEVVEQNANKQP